MLKQIIIIIGIYSLSLSTLSAQCIKEVHWPVGVLSAPTASGLEQLLAEDHKTTDFALVDNVFVGAIYEFDSDIDTDYITIKQAGGAAVIAHGTVPFVLTMPISGTVEMHLSASMFCGTDDFSRTTTIRCLNCTPVNDVCGTATELDVLEDLTCDTSSVYSIENANLTAFPTACVPMTYKDVWFSFKAVHSNHVLNFTDNGVLSPVDFEVFSGTCGLLSSMTCSFSTTQILDGLITGNTYFIRISEVGMAAPSMTNREICVGTYTPPTEVFLDPITTNNAQLNWTLGDGIPASTEIHICLEGDAVGSASCFSFSDTDGSPFLLSNLMSCTDYDVYLQEKYGSEFSKMVGPYTFQTDGFVNLNPSCGEMVRYPPCPSTDHSISDIVTFNICPSGGERVLVHFSYFDLETSYGLGLDGNGCWDYIELLDDGVSLGTFCSEDSGDGQSPINASADLSQNLTFMASTPGTCLTLEVTADGSIEETGIEFTVDCIDACPDNLYIGSTILSEDYPAKMKVSSDGTINDGENVIMRGETIELNAGFEIKMGAEYLGDIDPCN